MLIPHPSLILSLLLVWPLSSSAQGEAPIFQTDVPIVSSPPSEPTNGLQPGTLQPTPSSEVPARNPAPEPASNQIVAEVPFTQPAAATPTTGGELLNRWLKSYRGLQRLEVGFNQERRLRTIKLPIKSQGWMWMDVGSGRFRWQTGDPPKTIVVGESERIVIAFPKRRKVQYRDRSDTSSTEGAPPGFTMMSDFPRTVEAFKQRYQVLKVVQYEGFYELHARPLDSEMAKGVKELAYLIDAKEYFLRGFDIKLRDGSRIRSEFFHVKRNPVIDPRRFVFDATGYTEGGPDEDDEEDD